jgi:hypothetical protein
MFLNPFSDSLSEVNAKQKRGSGKVPRSPMALWCAKQKWHYAAGHDCRSVSLR